MTKQLMLVPLTYSIQLPLQLLLSQPFAQCFCKIPAHIMNNMSALDEALDILPFTVRFDGKAVKEAVIDQVAKELCSSLRQQASGSSFDVTDEAMKQALAGALIVTQQRVIANPPTLVKIAKKYQRRASTPALSNVSSMSNGGAGRPSRAESPEVSSSKISAGPGSSMLAGSLGMADFMNPEVLTTAKLWRPPEAVKS